MNGPNLLRHNALRRLARGSRACSGTIAHYRLLHVHYRYYSFATTGASLWSEFFPPTSNPAKLTRRASEGVRCVPRLRFGLGRQQQINSQNSTEATDETRIATDESYPCFICVSSVATSMSGSRRGGSFLLQCALASVSAARSIASFAHEPLAWLPPSCS